MGEVRLQGIPASEGIAVGPALRVAPASVDLPSREAESPEQELNRFHRAIQQAQLDLEALRERVRARAGAASAAIFEAQLLMLHDPMLQQGAQGRLQQGAPAEAAVVDTIEELAQMLASMADERFAARSADVRDVGRRLIRALLGQPTSELEAMTHPAIIVAHDLSPSDTAGLDPAKALGFCTAVGGQTSHTAILARTLGIPAVVGLGEPAVQRIADGQQLGLDGTQGLAVLDPGPGTLRQLQAERKRHTRRQAAYRRAASKPAQTADGARVRVGANIGAIESAQDAVQAGAEEVGLLRAEFLYLGAQVAPDEETQLAAYRSIGNALGGRPLVVRTLDLGGDKPPSFMAFPREFNPFLGWRAIRVTLDQPELFRVQLRAILRAAVGLRLSIMYPMVNDLLELRRANALLDQAREELRREGLAYQDPEQVGVMIETPAAALLADQLAGECDFVSLGTNDLIQYTLAVDRTNERVAGLYQPLHPAVLRSIQQVIQAVHACGKWVGMCGEMAGQRSAIPLLLGFGLDEFSMVPAAIPQAKWLIRRIPMERAQQLASQALVLHSAAEVEDLVDRALAELTD